MRLRIKTARINYTNTINAINTKIIFIALVLCGTALFGENLSDQNNQGKPELSDPALTTSLQNPQTQQTPTQQNMQSPQNTQTPQITTQESATKNPPKSSKNSFVFGIGFSSSERVFRTENFTNQENISKQNVTKYYAQGGNLRIHFGGIYAFNKSHALRYTLQVGFAKLGIYENAHKKDFEEANGFKYGANVIWIWNVFHHTKIDWGFMAGLFGTNGIYKKQNVMLNTLDIGTTIGMGMNIKAHHRLEFSVGYSFLSRFEVNDNGKNYIQNGTPVFMTGLNYFYYL